ncbi:hypothetical protein [Pseudomonas sp. S9]|uniref:hypothetical protein n=1 Tax=Pseudomonas sp. S9 TaxID=686578 RepID=UPI00025570FE|nr:hypothetical protein [Pseudomonas sp. S9]
MKTVLNLLSAAAVVISGAVASTAPGIDTGANTHAQVKARSVPTFKHQPLANSAARTAAFLPAADGHQRLNPSQVELMPNANQRWVF